jgi:sugar transferase (PEP-CTERM system associated)
MFKILNVYYPKRTIALFVCEALLICISFLGAAVVLLGQDAYLALEYQSGILKIAGLTSLALLLSHYLDLYAPHRLAKRWEVHFRLFLLIGGLSFIAAAVIYMFPQIYIGHQVLIWGLLTMTVVLSIWRIIYAKLIAIPYFREKVYVMGCGNQARSLVETLRSRPDAGMDVVGWNGSAAPTSAGPDQYRQALASLDSRVDRVIVALDDRRGTMPIRDLLDLRLKGVIVQDATSIIEHLVGKLSLDGLTPSSLVFSEGFKVKVHQQLPRRIASFLVALIALVILLPFIPLLILAVRLSSPGPVFFHQKRVGLNGKCFMVHKFRTMRQDAEAKGAMWATKNDPRVTRLGRLMRKTRLDEIPQLWNVLCGDMGLVGPRPERPEFVESLSRDIPYYNLRHMIRPGLTGWAQVRYQYGATIEETRHKLEYDLYYIKRASLSLDLLIMFETIKTIVLRRGAQ